MTYYAFVHNMYYIYTNFYALVVVLCCCTVVVVVVAVVQRGSSVCCSCSCICHYFAILFVLLNLLSITATAECIALLALCDLAYAGFCATYAFLCACAKKIKRFS